MKQWQYREEEKTKK